MLTATVILKGLTLTIALRRSPDQANNSLVPYVLRGPIHEEGIDLEFYKEAIKRFDDDEAFPELFNDAMNVICTKLGTMSMEDDYKKYVQVGPSA